MYDISESLNCTAQGPDRMCICPNAPYSVLAACQGGAEAQAAFPPFAEHGEAGDVQPAARLRRERHSVFAWAGESGWRQRRNGEYL